MMLGMPTATFTLLHIIISLIGIFSGFLVLLGMFRAKRLPGWTALFLTTTIWLMLDSRVMDLRML
jgi:hypothetical protein